MWFCESRKGPRWQKSKAKRGSSRQTMPKASSTEPSHAWFCEEKVLSELTKSATDGEEPKQVRP